MPPSQPFARGHAFPLLDGARGLAALAVVGFHAAAVLRVPAVFEFAFLGVDFFFLLSGFVVGHAYGPGLAAGGGLRRFAATRFARLYPMIVLGSLVGAPLLGSKLAAGGLARSLAFSLALVPHVWGAPGPPLFPLDPALWSLFFEVAANVAFALAARRAGVRTLAAVCAVSLPLMALAGSLHVGWERASFLQGFPRTAFSFGAGLLLQRLHAAGRLPSWRLAGPCALGALAAALALPLPMPHGRFPVLLGYVAVLFPAILVALAGARPGPRAARLCRWAGEVSYPLYAIHAPVVFALGAALVRARAPEAERVGAVFALMAATTLLAAAASRWIDRPARAWLSTRLLGRRAAPPSPDAVVAAEGPAPGAGPRR